MRSDRDKRTDTEREIDEFLASFETPVDELSADINSYLDTDDTTRMTAARTFYGQKYSASPEPEYSGKHSSSVVIEDDANTPAAPGKHDKTLGYSCDHIRKLQCGWR